MAEGARSGRLGLAGRTSASWGVAGGLVAALVVSFHMFAGSLSSSVGFLTATFFFLVGAVVGFVHGGLLGYLGRPPEVDRATALRRIALGAVYEVPVLVGGWAVAMVLALSAGAWRAGRYGTFAVTVVGWVAAVAVFVWAALETQRALRHMLGRWPDGRAVLVTVALAALALLPVFVVVRPEMWVLGLEPTPTAAALMALAAAAWIVAPLTAVALLVVRLVRRRLAP